MRLGGRRYQEAMARTSDDERGKDVKSVSAVSADCSGGCGRACQVEEDACVCPFLEPRKTGHKYRNGPKRLPNPQDGDEVHRIVKDGHDAVDGSLYCASPARRPRLR